MSLLSARPLVGPSPNGKSTSNGDRENATIRERAEFHFVGGSRANERDVWQRAGEALCRRTNMFEYGS